ncbi:hypothetical protein WSM22_02600 [Cytophagales bacterium WSM2-2]|nr:hypothetical protein WSM22_02600 [Cytophagales bacterium WSM2-2]
MKNNNMSTEFAKSFAEDWVTAWNSHDITTIMEHYADELDFNSPVIQQIRFNDEGRITNKKDLQSYFSKALNIYPEVEFKLHDVCIGTESLVLYYTSINNKKVAEVMFFNVHGRISKVMAHYN